MQKWRGGKTALMKACDSRHLETAKLLLHRGAVVNFQDEVRVLHRIARKMMRNNYWWFGGLLL
jgi:ankyrin repeat protein